MLMPVFYTNIDIYISIDTPTKTITYTLMVVNSYFQYLYSIDNLLNAHANTSFKYQFYFRNDTYIKADTNMQNTDTNTNANTNTNTNIDINTPRQANNHIHMDINMYVNTTTNTHTHLHLLMYTNLLAII